MNKVCNLKKYKKESNAQDVVNPMDETLRTGKDKTSHKLPTMFSTGYPPVVQSRFEQGRLTGFKKVE